MRIIPEQDQVTTDGLYYARLRYTDTDGCWKPTVRGKVQVDVSGGTLLGLGSGCPYVEDRYLNTITDTYYGEAMAVIRPDEPGKITIRADSPFGSEKQIVHDKQQIMHDKQQITHDKQQTMHRVLSKYPKNFNIIKRFVKK